MKKNRVRYIKKKLCKHIKVRSRSSDAIILIRSIKFRSNNFRSNIFRSNKKTTDIKENKLGCATKVGLVSETSPSSVSSSCWSLQLVASFLS